MSQAESAWLSDYKTRMPLLRQQGPSCGNACLAMCLEYHGFPASFEVIEPYLHPYGLDSGEVPSELARYARMVGFSARHYNHSALDQIATHILLRRTVTVMLNLHGGTGHIVNVVGLTRNSAGEITTVGLRNPWGYDHTVSSKQFLRDWKRMRLIRESHARFLPVFDRSMVVIAPPDVKLPASSLMGWLHSAPVSSLIAAVNGVGIGLKTIRNGSFLLGTLQFAGNAVKTIAGVFVYIVGNFVGKNLEWSGQELYENSKSCKATACGLSMQRVGQLISTVGGGFAGLLDLVCTPLIGGGQWASRRHAVREHILSTDDTHLSALLARSNPGAVSFHLKTLTSGFFLDPISKGDREAASRILKLHPHKEQLDPKMINRIQRLT